MGRCVGWRPAVVDQSALRRGKPEFGENTLVVGDGRRDMEIARDAKLRSVGVARSNNENELLEAGANYLIQDLDGLLNILAPGDDHRVFIPISQLPR